ncbi:hypothetical protein JTB14_018711 [Gonioctena quinquepunctata]|nr:hypothetical protein JTB14_018711 [Gonioctena quinquepunctata]
MFKAILLLAIFCAGVFSQRPYYRNTLDIGCDRESEIEDSCPMTSCRVEARCEDRQPKKRNCEYSYGCGETKCFCKEGYARHAGKCIPLDECP